MTFREATFSDYQEIAHLHALSWQRTYRGMMSDDFLDNQVVAERLAVWQERLSTTDSNRLVLLAIDEDEETIQGFVCVFAEYDPIFGAFIDNLHVRPVQKGQGIGTQLIRKAAEWVTAKRPHTALYLWVLEGNHMARKFYEKMGAVNHERIVKPTPYGRDSIDLRYVWNDAETMTI